MFVYLYMYVYRRLQKLQTCFVNLFTLLVNCECHFEKLPYMYAVF